jgi:large subunit ribosomal protein L29
MKNSFKSLSYPELKAKRDELKKKYMDLRFQMVIGHVDNPLQRRNMRRQIARLNTLVHIQELADKKAAAVQSAEAAKGSQNLEAK